MKISDVVEQEATNDAILLHREGIFLKAYEMSAYRFVNHIKSYNIKSKYYKNIKKDIIYMGFPSSYMDTIAAICSTKGYEVSGDRSLLKIDCISDITGYDVWKDGIVQEGIKMEDEHKPQVSELLQEIAAYPLASKTPMEVQQFLYEIQLKINGNL